MAQPDCREVVRKRGVPEPGLWIDLRSIVVDRIDQFVRMGKPDRKLCRAFQISSPPIPVTLVLFDSLHNNQPIWVDCQDSIACPFCRQTPVSLGITAAPGCRPVWLVVQISADHSGIPTIMPGQ